MKRMISNGLLLMALITIGCQKDDCPTPSTDPADREVSFAATIAMMTRNPQLNEDGSGSFNTGDTFTLYAYHDATGSSTIDYAIGLSTLYWRDLAFATEGEKINFAACYPSQILDGDSFNFKVEQNTNSDLLIAGATDVNVGEERPIALTFRHATHRLVVKFTSKDSSLVTESIETRCTAYATGQFHLTSGTFTQGDTKETYTATGSQVAFLLLPQSTQDVTLEVRIGDVSNRWTLTTLDPQFQTIEQGKELTVNFTIQNGEISFSGMTIEGWGDQGTIDDEIIV